MPLYGGSVEAASAPLSWLADRPGQKTTRTYLPRERGDKKRMTSRPEQDRKTNGHTVSENDVNTTAAGNTRKVFVRTYGCQMNVYDSERMTDVLGPEGYEATNTLEDADLVILNTCHIREKAAE